MSDSFWIVLTIVGTCAFIFVASIALAPLVRRIRRAQGDTRPEPPMSKQARTLAIICIGSGVVTALWALGDGNVALQVAAAVIFVVMMVAVLVLSVRDGRRARRGAA
jgi:hypothetical protein